MKSASLVVQLLLVAASSICPTVAHTSHSESDQRILAAEREGGGVKAANESLTWGTYRPNLYFGLKPRIPNSLMTGVMWFGLQDHESARSEFRSGKA
jgi:hypothetical protein